MINFVLYFNNLKKTSMKKLFKVSSYILATVLAFVLSNVSAFAANNTTDNAPLSGGQVIGGLAILLLVILVPIMKSARKATIN
jgi:hypothetical protein